MDEEYLDFLEEEYFTDLRYMVTNSGQYSRRQGELYEELRSKDARFDRADALAVASYLNRGKVESAFDEVQNILENESE